MTAESVATAWKSWDFAKAAVALYIIGLVITATYYVRFSILSVDLLQPHSILVGLSFVVLYIVVPAITLLLLRSSKSILAITLIFCSVVVMKELAFSAVCGDLHWISAFVLAILQVLTFMRLSRNISQRQSSLRFNVVPSDPIGIAAVLLTALVFASTTYGRIPSYLGGGKPTLVHVFTKEQELPGNRFIRNRNLPQINKKLISYRLQLLYESANYLYFVTETRGKLTGYSIMRLKRDEVLRMDYVTPVWFSVGR